MTKKHIASLLRLCLLIVLLAGIIFQPQFSAQAAPVLTIEPITWNVIGLDSNNVNVGPNHFPIGARICNTGDATATNLNSTFVWDSANALINLRPGTLTSISTASLAAGACTDVYFEVEVTRNAAAYDTTRNYHIAVTAAGGLSASTPTPRTLYVEHLVSQNRNAVTDVQYGATIGTLASVAPGGTMTLMVGNTYFIRLVGFTATQGYEQLESFINIPNVIFQTLSVATTYTADTSATVSSPNDKAYGNACIWENDPSSPNYRSCLSTGKVGGNITVTYQVMILQVPGAPLVNPAPLSSLIYDFSGSSYHYNADYGVSTRFANIVNASIIKSFSPKTINPGGTSTLTFTVNNPGAVPLTGVNFSDNLPAGVTISNTAITYNGCGTPAPASLTLGATSVSFSNITVAGLGACTAAVSVTASADAIYNNTSSNLFINTNQDTGSFATDTLVVTSKPPAPSSCPGSEVILASWSFPPAGQGSGGGATTPDYTTKQADVATATALYTAGALGTPTINTAQGSPAVNSWRGEGGWASNNTGFPSATTGPYFTFTVDTSNYGGVRISYNYALLGNGDWANPGDNYLYTYSSSNGAAYSNLSTIVASKGSWLATGNINAASTGTSTTAFRINAVGANKTTSAAHIDEVIIQGCVSPVLPTLSKSFLTSPIPQGTNSTLRFTLTNPNASTALTGVGFSDTLPTGLLIATPNGLVTSCTTGTFTGATTTATQGTTLISVSGGTLSANANCTISINVLGNVAGSYTNVSTPITSTATGPNTTGTGFGTSSLTVIAPPVISKSFTANPIFTGNITNLTFSINNPNTSTTLTGVNFTDNLPAGLVVATPNGLSNTCGGTATAVAASSVISLSGVNLAAGTSCTVSVNVTGSTVGLKTNSVTAESTNGGTGNTSTANVLVKDPAPALTLLKQVGPTASGPWTPFLGVTAGSNVYYRLAVENTGDVALSGVDVTDPDPNVDPSTCSWVDGDGTPLVAPFNLPVANANDDQLAICVLGPVSAASGSHSNTATVDDNNPGVPSATDTSTATYATPELTLDKTAAESSFTLAGDALNYSYLVTNSGSVPLLGPVTVADDKATVTCPAVSTAVQTAPPGPGDGDNWLDPGESITCTASYTVQPADATAGFVTNTATATIDSINSNQDSLTINQVRPDLTVTKANNVSGSVAQNGSFNWTLTVANNGAATASFANTQVIMNDTLPGVAGYYPQGVLTVTNGGTAPTGAINCSITGTALSCVASGAVTLPVNASFSVTFAVTPTVAGSLANTAIVDPNGNITESNEGNNTGLDTVAVVAPPSISKSFSPNPVVAGVSSTLTITITNSNTAMALTGVAFVDTYPAGLVNTTPASTSNTCGGTLTASNGGGSVSLSGGTIAANSSCTITTVVIAAAGGDYANITGSVSSTNGGTGNTASSTLNVFDTSPTKSIVTTSEASTGFVSPTERVTIGEMIRYRLATRMPEGAFTNVQLTDNIPNGLQFVDDGTATVAFVCNGGAACMTSSTLAGVDLVVSGSSSSISPTFVLPGGAISGGPFVSGTDVTFSFGDITNTDNDADAEYIVVEFNALVLNVNSSATINQGVDNDPLSGTFGDSNTNFRLNNTTLSISGSQVGSASPNVSVAIAEPSISSITKSVSPAVGPYLPGDSLIYTMQFSNNATGNNATTAFDIVLTDTFDANLTLGAVNVTSTQGTSGVDTCAGGTSFVTNNSTVGQLVTVNVSCLDPAETVTVTVDVTISVGASSGTTIANTADLTYTSLPGAQGNCATSPFTCTGVGGSGSGTGERDGSEGSGADDTVLNNYAVTSNTTNTTVTSGTPNLTIVKSLDSNADEDTSGTVSLNDTLTYSVTATNTGNTTLTNVTVTDNLITPNTNTCLTVAPGATCVLTGTYVVTQADVDAGQIDNTGSVTDDDVCTTACDDPNTVPVPQTPNLTIVKTLDSNADEDGSATVSLNDTLTYSVTATNTGNTTLTNVTVTDDLITPNTNTCLTVTPGATCVLTGTYVVSQADVDAGQIDNTGSVTDDDVCTTACDDPNTVPVPQTPSISIVKSPAAQSVLSGGTANFTLTVTNTGNITLTNVVVTDAQCTTGPTFTGGDTNTDNQLQLTETWTYSCSIANVTADFTNTADVSTAEGATDSATADVTVASQQVDLELDKSVNNTTPLVATNIIFTLTVTNVDPVDATNVVVTDVLPSGFTYVTDNSGGAYNDLTGVWTVGTVAANSSESITITVSVNATGSYTNYAQITGVTEVDPDSTPNNGPQTPDEDDDDSVTVTPTQNDPSGLTKSVSSSNQAFTTNPNVAIGEIVEYTVNVTIPPGVFANSQMVDTMERGLSFMSCASITPSDADLTTDVAGSFASACSTPTVDDAGGGTTVDVGRRVTFDLGTLTNASGADQTLTFVYTAVVLDSAANVSGVTLSNSAEWSSDSGSLPPSSATVLIVEPDVSISKTANASLVSVGSEITFTLIIQHTGSSQTNAYDTVVTDVLPAELQFVPGSLLCTSGAQDPDVTCAESGGTITAEWSNFALGGGNGQVSFRVTVVSLPALGISNVANVAWSSLPGDVSTPQNSNVFSTERDYDPASNIDVYGASDTLVIGVFNNTPATGFAPNEVTDLGNVPSVVYKQTGGVTVEIPSLGITLPIVGVPLKNGEWDVSWLGNQAGWLDGTAFPSWSGNSVLTSHVYGSNGLPGPFVNLNGLRYGDKIIVRAYGQMYTYEVRTNTVVEPNDASIFRHEEKAWLTLVTCKEYDETTNTYGKRVVVRAVLVGVSR